MLKMNQATVHTSADIEKMLALGLSPITDSENALSELGFVRSFPAARRGGYEASVYERSVDHGYRMSGVGARRFKAQRAFLVTSKVLAPTAA